MFVLMEGEEAEAAMVNACWNAILRLGLPMVRSVWAKSHEGHTLVIDQHGKNETIFGKYRNPLDRQDLEQMKEFAATVRQSLEASLC